MMFRKATLTLLMSCSLAFTACSQKKQECNDPFALNFNDSAKSNVACNYNSRNQAPTLLHSLPNLVRETSGLVWVDGRLLTHNDKGGRAELYALNPENGQLAATYELSGVANVDWEELAQSPEHVYVADMGNNDGNRSDLRIYKIAKSDLSASGGTVVAAAVIDFHYPEQQSLFPSSKHNWDAEALLWANGALYLFTKNRLDAQTALYRIPDQAGDHAAVKLGSFHAGVRITGATISADGRKAVLLGYNKDEQCVLWMLSGFSGQDFLGAEKERIVLGSYSSLGQMEGLDFGPDGALYLTAESSGGQPARLYRLDF